MIHPSPRSDRALVVGLGSIDRGDDAVGLVVAGLIRDEVTARGAGNVHVVVHEDPTALVDLMEDATVVVIVDATRSGAPAGTLTLREVGRGELPLSARKDPGPAGTHGLGLATAIELARALDRLPDRVVVVGIEAVGFEHGRALSPPVAAAVPSALEAVLGILQTGGPRADP